MLSELTALLERLVAELPAGTAAVHVRQLSRDKATQIDVKPTNPASADFGVLADESQVFSFGFGPRSNWEFPWERRYRKGEKEILEIEEMSRAVIAGKCEQRRRAFWLTAKIHMGNYTYKMIDMPMLPFPPFWTRRYAPYAPPNSELSS